MNSLLRAAITGVTSLTQCWLAHSAVPITSMPITSHSGDFASSRWTSWLRCSSADSESSNSVALTALCDLLYASIVLWKAPLTSFGRHNVTLPLAPFAAAGVNTLPDEAVEVGFAVPELDDPPPLPLSPPPPQPASTAMQLAATIHALALIVVSSCLPARFESGFETIAEPASTQAARPPAGTGPGLSGAGAGFARPGRRR